MIKTFDFYLDAYHYCTRHKIDPASIYRLDWKNWAINFENMKEKNV